MILKKHAYDIMIYCFLKTCGSFAANLKARLFWTILVLGSPCHGSLLRWCTCVVVVLQLHTKVQKKGGNYHHCMALKVMFIKTKYIYIYINLPKKGTHSKHINYISFPQKQTRRCIPMDWERLGWNPVIITGPQRLQQCCLCTSEACR